MAIYYLQKLPEGMKEGEKVVYPRMQTYTLHDFETVLKHVHTYAGNISEGTMRAVLEALTETMKSELIYPGNYTSAEVFKKDLVEYIEYYNNERI